MTARSSADDTPRTSMNILHLPAELLCLIAEHVPLGHLRQLRLANAELARKTAHAFEQCVVDTRWRISADSLTTLQRVSEQPRVSQKFNRLRISTHFLCPRASTIRTGFRAKPHLPVLDQKTSEQREWLKSDAPLKMLTAVMRMLTSLERVEIGQWCSPGDYYDQGWGGPQYQRQYHYRLDPFQYGEDRKTDRNDTSQGYSSALTYCFSYTLGALAVAHRPIEQLSAVLWRWHDGIKREEIRGLEVLRMKTLHAGSPLAQQLTIPLSNLTNIQLALEYQGYGPGPGTRYRRNNDTTSWLTTFLSLAPKLQSLTLVFEAIDVRRMEDDRPQTLYDCLNPATHFLQHSNFLLLRSFELARVACVPEAFQGFLERHAPTLQRLALRSVQIPRKHPMTWQRIFDDLRQDPHLSLQHIHLSHLYHGPSEPLPFRTDGLAACARCLQRPQSYDAVFMASTCRHVNYTSSMGELPRTPSAQEVEAAMLEQGGRSGAVFDSDEGD